MLAKTELSEPRQILLKAAEVIERDGWYGGHRGGWCPVKAKCLMMAISYVPCNANVDQINIKSEAFKLFVKHIGVDDVDCIPEWNDSHTEEQCLEALRNAAYSGV